MIEAVQALRAEKRDLAGGARLLHSRASANPSVVLRALIRAGASRESGADEQGLAGLVGRMLRQGSRSISKGALAEELDGMGAGLTVDVGYSLTVVSIKCLSDDFERAAEILAEVALHPTFPAAELETVRGQVLTDLREMEDNTRVVAEKLWRSAAYPATHRYSRLVSGTMETIPELSREGLAAFHDRWFASDQTTLIAVGDVTIEESQGVLERAFVRRGKPGAAPLQDTLPETAPPEPVLLRQEMRGKTQCDVALGVPALSRASADYYALAFANHILGRLYFMGRFGEKVRDEQGLAYYAHSELAAGHGTGPWLVRAGVNPANLDKAIASIRAELERFLAGGPTPAEMEDGASSLIGSLPRQLETNEGVAAVLGEIDLYGLGLDYLDRYPAIIRALTHQQVLEASARYLQPERMITAIAGPPTA